MFIISHRNTKTPIDKPFDQKLNVDIAIQTNGLEDARGDVKQLKRRRNGIVQVNLSHSQSDM